MAAPDVPFMDGIDKAWHDREDLRRSPNLKDERLEVDEREICGLIPARRLKLDVE